MKDFNFEDIKTKKVAYFKKKNVKIDTKILKYLKLFSACNKFKKSRICAHTSKKSDLHEMIIFHEQGYYIRPHSHPGRSESIHVIKGMVDLILFDSEGCIIDIVEMGDYSSNKIFFHRLNSETTHTLIIKSKELIFHETSLGPFKKNNTIFAKWSPKKSNKNFQNELKESIDDYKKLQKKK